MSLGRVEENKLEQLSEAISKHLETVSILSLSKEIDIADTYILGPLLVLDRMMEAMGIKAALQNVLSQHKKLQFDFEKVVFNQLCSRIIKHVSKLSLHSGLAGCIKMIDHIDLQHIIGVGSSGRSQRRYRNLFTSERICSPLTLM
jgi:hypothetical protein